MPDASWAAFLEEQSAQVGVQRLEPAGICRGSFDGRLDHAVLLWHRRDRETYGDVAFVEESLLEVYQLERVAGTAVKATRIVQQSFQSSAELEEHNGRDVNGDGTIELVLRVSTGGNCWGCQHIELFQLHRGQLIEVPTPASGSVVPIRLDDLDGDGRFEVLAIDARWEGGFGKLCHACSPGVLVIYRWEDGRYVEASRRFPQFYEAEIARLEGDLRDPFNDGSSIGRAASVLLNYLQKGEAQRGWERFQTFITPSRFRDPQWASVAQEIAAALRRAYGL